MRGDSWRSTVRFAHCGRPIGAQESVADKEACVTGAGRRLTQELGAASGLPDTTRLLAILVGLRCAPCEPSHARKKEWASTRARRWENRFASFVVRVLPSPLASEPECVSFRWAFGRSSCAHSQKNSARGLGKMAATANAQAQKKGQGDCMAECGESPPSPWPRTWDC